jgi:hypothetical protein
LFNSVWQVGWLVTLQTRLTSFFFFFFKKKRNWDYLCFSRKHKTLTSFLFRFFLQRRAALLFFFHFLLIQCCAAALLLPPARRLNPLDALSLSSLCYSLWAHCRHRNALPVSLPLSLSLSLSLSLFCQCCIRPEWLIGSIMTAIPSLFWSYSSTPPIRPTSWTRTQGSVPRIN